MKTISILAFVAFVAFSIAAVQGGYWCTLTQSPSCPAGGTYVGLTDHDHCHAGGCVLGPNCPENYYPSVDTCTGEKVVCVASASCPLGYTLDISSDQCVKSTYCEADGNACTQDTCDTSTGNCDYKPITCNTPPPNTCSADGTKKITYNSTGTCNSATGNCEYTSTETTCTYGCSGGACNPPPPDTTPPSTSVASVAGDTSSPYWDTSNDAQTNIVVSGESGMLCRWGTSDVVYSSMSNQCSVSGSTATCSLGSLSQGSYTRYVSCRDSVGNEQSTTQNLDVSFGVDWTYPVRSNGQPTGYITTTTPTMSLTTNEAATCKYSSLSTLSYDDMTLTFSTTGGTSHSQSLSLSETSYTFYIKCKDSAGNKNTDNYQISFTIDTTAPTGSITINNNATYTTSTSVTLSLSCSDTGSGCSKMNISNTYEGLKTALMEAYTASKSWTLLSGDGTKAVYVKYKDGAGLWSDAYTDTIILDTTPPTVSISISPSSPTSTDQVTFSASASDNVDVDKITIYIDENNDGSYLDATQTCFSTTCSITRGPYSAGQVIRYYALAWDKAGNRGDTPTKSFTVSGADTTPPTGSIVINNGDAYTKSTSVTLSLSCSDASGCSKMNISNTYAGLDTATEESYVASKSWTLLSGDGTKAVYVKYKDGAGLWSDAYTDTIELDTTPPDTTIDSGPSGTVLSTDATFTFSSTEIGSTFQCRLDSESFSLCTSPKSYTGLSAGIHTFEVSAIDSASNADPTPASRSWTIVTCTYDTGKTLVAGLNAVNFETRHNYDNNEICGPTDTYSCPAGHKAKVWFARLETEGNYDFFYIYDGNLNLLEALSGTPTFTGGSISNEGFTQLYSSNTIRFKFTSDVNIVKWGVNVDSIYCEPTVGPQGPVTLYDLTTYQGQFVDLVPTPVAQANNFGFEPSSVIVPSGYVLTLYDQNDFTGVDYGDLSLLESTCRVILSDKPNLGSLNFDIVRSAKSAQAWNGFAGAILYVNAIDGAGNEETKLSEYFPYRATPYLISSGELNPVQRDSACIRNHPNIAATTEVSAVKLANGYGVTLYTGTSPPSNCRSFFNTINDLNTVNFNDPELDSVVVWNGYNGAILYMHDKFSQNGKTEYFPEVYEGGYSKKYSLTQYCMKNDASSIQIAGNYIVAAYKQTSIRPDIIFVPPQNDFGSTSLNDQIYSIRVCAQDSITCLPSAEDTIGPYVVFTSPTIDPTTISSGISYTFQINTADNYWVSRCQLEVTKPDTTTDIISMSLASSSPFTVPPEKVATDYKTGSASYQFNIPGTYTVKARCWDLSGGYNAPQKTIIVPWRVFLSAFLPVSADVPVNTNVDLTAIANWNVAPSYYIHIYDGSFPTPIKSCASGTTCVTTVTSNTPVTKTYTAKIAKSDGSDVQASSDPVSVKWYESCGSCSSAKLLGAGTLNNYEDIILSDTCSLSSTSQDEIFKFTVNKKGYAIVYVLQYSTLSTRLDNTWKYSTNYCTGTGVSPVATEYIPPPENLIKYSLPVDSGSYSLDIKWVSGSGNTKVSAELVECLFDTDCTSGWTCDLTTNLCKPSQPCKSCADAKNLGVGSISTGGYEASYTCPINATNTQDWFKITANNNNKLRIDLTPPSGSDFNLGIYPNDCSSPLCSSTSSGKDSCKVDAIAGTTYKIKAYHSTGSGGGAISANLEECFDNFDCTAKYGSGWTCDLTTNLCKPCENTCPGEEITGLTSIGSSVTKPMCSLDITAANDEYWYKFTPGTSGKAIVSTSTGNFELYSASSCVGIPRYEGTLTGSSIQWFDVSAGITSYMKLKRTSGSGTTDVTVRLGECIYNDVTYGDANTKNDRSSVCVAKDPSRPWCDIAGIKGTPYKCQPPEPCGSNPECPPDQCCTADSVLPLSLREPEGSCVNKGLWKQPYLCTS